MTGRLTVAQMLLQQIVTVLPLVQDDAAIPAADDDLLLVRLDLLLRQVETCRCELGRGENPRRLPALERLPPFLVRGVLPVLATLRRGANGRQPRSHARSLSNFWHDQSAAQSSGMNMDNAVYT